MGESVVVITGSASGIGRATAAAYLHEGATVYGFDVALDQPDPLDGEVRGTWVPRHLDVSDTEAVRAEFERIASEHARIDVLVTSAAVGFAEPFAQMPVASWDRVLGINLTGTMACIQATLALELMSGSGSIVVVSSIAGRSKSVANGAHYTVSKYGLIGLTRHLAAELAGTDIRINCVAPGPTNSPILTANATDEEVAAIVDRTPLRRIAEPEDVAAVVLFAASPAARHVHGAVLDVNGGMF